MNYVIPYIAIVPARAGSKGISKKNMTKLGGKSLISWSIQVAKKASIFQDIVISSDDDEFLEEGRQSGATVLLNRPAYLATDITKQIDVLVHASKELQKMGKNFEGFVLLQPTCPFRRPNDLIAAVNLHEKSKNATLISVCEVSSMDDSSLYEGNLDQLESMSLKSEPQGTLRQNFAKRFWRNGSIYILNRKDIDNGNLYSDKIIGFEMSAHESINIDEGRDLVAAQNFLTSVTGREIQSEVWS